MERHFTATAFVVDSRHRVLLLWHKRLNRWMPPGGHIDPNETPEAAARRECQEETGLDVEILSDEQPNVFADAPHEGTMLQKPFAMLLENIPASAERNEPAHEHMDFLFIAKPRDETKPLRLAEAESSEIRWFTRDEVAALDEKTEIFTNVKAYILAALAA